MVTEIFMTALFFNALVCQRASCELVPHWRHIMFHYLDLFVVPKLYLQLEVIGHREAICRLASDVQYVSSK